MRIRSARISLVATILAALPGVAFAQFPPPAPPAGSAAPVQDRWPEMPPAGASRSQGQRPARAEPQQAAPQAKPARQPEAARDDAPAPKPKPTAAPATAVVCGGVFAKDSTHLKLAI